MSTAAPRPPDFDDALPPSEPAWDIARLFPAQGHWAENDYLDLPGNHLVELVDGRVEVLPMPSLLHQLIVAFLYEAFTAHVRSRGLGTILFAPMPVRTGPGRYRKPDLLLIGAGSALEPHAKACERPDLVVEVLSDSNRARDLETKRREYAQAGISEYWIVDPTSRVITVLALPAGGTTYGEYGSFVPGDRARSRVLPDFSLDVASALNPTR